MKRGQCIIGLCFLLASCLGERPNSSSSIPSSDVEESTSTSLMDSSSTSSEDSRVQEDRLSNGTSEIRFEATSGGGFRLALFEDGTKRFFCQKPASIAVRAPSNGVLDTFSQRSYSAAYDKLEKVDNALLASAEVTTDGGSTFLVKDRYYLLPSSKGFAVDREVEVLVASSEDYGFSSTFSLLDVSLSEDPSEFTFFIPSILYKDTSDMRSGSIASNLDLTGNVTVKETRAGLPMVFLRNSDAGSAVALSHLRPEISSPVLGGGANGYTDAELQYGSIGYSITPSLGVNFTYPCAEGPNTYDYGASTTRRYHPVEQGFVQSYSLGIYSIAESTHNDAMVEAYIAAYNDNAPKAPTIGMKTIYDQNLDLLIKEYRYDGTGNVYGGEPWSLTLPNATADQGYSSQFGFVGQQAAVGYQLYRYGKEHSNIDAQQKGETTLNFWSSSTINSSYFPIVWWDPSSNAQGGNKRDYPVFLRCAVDGMEALLDASLYAASIGETKTQWITAVNKFGKNLVAKQNEDGSFYRAYENDGSPCTRTDNSSYQGTSPLNTPIAVRFLAKMYEFTGDETYKASAIKAAEYSYQTLYLEKGKYVGGTPDNPNTVDKEAAVYAIHCFDAAYTLTKDEKYLKAAMHAGVCAFSWMYTYDFKVYAQENYSSINVFSNGGTMGFSFIATGHSSADNYIAYAFFALYRLYLESGNEFFKDAAILVENATKLCTDYDGRMGFKYPAMMPEATTISDFAFKSVGTWLPWSSIANIEPILQTKVAFGSYDIEGIALSSDEQLSALETYGMGGKRSE